MRALKAMLIPWVAVCAVAATASVSPHTSKFGNPVPIDWTPIFKRLKLTDAQTVKIQIIEAQAVLRWNTARANVRIDAAERRVEMDRTRRYCMSVAKRVLRSNQFHDFELEGGEDLLIGGHPYIEEFDALGIDEIQHNKIRQILYDTRKRVDAMPRGNTDDLSGERRRVWRQGVNKAAQLLTPDQQVRFSIYRVAPKASRNHVPLA